MANSFHGIAPIAHLGVLLASGEDSRQFLHSQLSNDFKLLGHDKARLAAFLTAKGRMQASFIGLRHGEQDVLLIGDQSLLAAVHKRLSMFILRSKTRLTDVSSQWRLYGLAGDAVTALAPQTQQPWDVQQSAPGQYAIRLYPALGAERALWLAPAEAPAPGELNLSAPDWRHSEVESAVATLSAPVVDAFVPQMLNYESVGGVHFQKGCYPGQEVVARSQFRGAIKRRTFVAHGQQATSEPPIAAGDEVFAEHHPAADASPCGLVVQVAPVGTADTGAFAALVSLQTNATEGELSVRKAGAEAATAQAVPITLAPLPYPLRDDI